VSAGTRAWSFQWLCWHGWVWLPCELHTGHSDLVFSEVDHLVVGALRGKLPGVAFAATARTLLEQASARLPGVLN